jgi:hypothetical protein
MSENMSESGETLVIPVTVTQKKNVGVAEKNSKTDVLFINSKGHAHMVPENMAKDLVKRNKGHIMDKAHKEYIKYYKMALGYDEKIGSKKFLQKAGKVMSIEDATRADISSLVQRETIEAEKARKDAGGK